MLSTILEKTSLQKLNKLVLIRHGQSLWNAENKFTGWYNSILSEKGCEEAQNAANLLNAKKLYPDKVFTSFLSRSIKTANIILENLKYDYIPTTKAWELNERHYGNLTGMCKNIAREQFGEDKVGVWRRSYDIPPPNITESNEHIKEICDFNKYNSSDSFENFPHGESLEMTLERVLPYYNNNILPEIKQGNTIFIVAHGNSLRSLVKYIENINNDEIIKYEIPTAQPIVYTLDTFGNYLQKDILV